MQYLKPEEQARLEIDKQLEKAGWKISDKEQVWAEVDTKQSDFNIRNYKIVSETLKNDEESAYADYLLLDEVGDPLAVIEAKRTSKDPIVGQKQAEMYANDIQKQTGKEVFVFFSNGVEIWFWNRPHENPHLVMGFHSQDDLERLRFQNAQKKGLSTIHIKEEIVNRPYQIESVKRVLEGIDRGKRKFLLVLATGTGKTRVAMGIVDVLLRASRAERVLFLADRKALRDQAYDAFQDHIPHELKSKIVAGNLEKNHKIHVSTIQTFMECYQEFSVGSFDVIISDEAHRSIYNKWREVFTYFDAIQIGLTATPSEFIERDTFRFFQCDGQQPTALYSYDSAVKEGHLCPYKVYQAQTNFQIKGIAPEDLPSHIKKRLLEEGMEEEDMAWEGTEIEKKVAVIGTNEAIVKEFMDNCLMDETGTLPAKTIFFAVSKQHAKRLWESFEKMYPEYKGRLARVITSEDSRAQQLLKDFKTESFPRIAISVDMLDTGVDIPEVCNLAFAKPVFSRIKFLQMIGRGTRHDKTCSHRDWLPFGKKEHFLIFDFWNNFEYFKMRPEGNEAKPSEAITTRIFKTQVEQLKSFLSLKDEARAEGIREKIKEAVMRLPKESAGLRPHLPDVDLVLGGKIWDNVGVDAVEFLSKKITPLMKFQTDVNMQAASFVLKCEKLGLAILQEDSKGIESLKGEIGEDLNCLPRSLQQVKDKEDLLDKVLSSLFWKRISYDDSQMLKKEFAPLMPYKRAEPRRITVLDIDDLVRQRKIVEYGTEPKQEYVEVYREKVEKKVRELAQKDPVLRKIREEKAIYGEDLEKLERTLNGSDLGITEETLQQAYEQNKGTLVQFIKQILGLYRFPDPKERIEEEFKSFVVANNSSYTADQINFLRALTTVFSKKKHIEYHDLFEPPFTNFGTHSPIPLFSEEELTEMVNLCQKLEKELFV